MSDFSPNQRKPERKRRPKELSEFKRLCPPIPPHILSNGKSNGLMWIDGAFVHVCEGDANGCIVHRPDLMAQLNNCNVVIERKEPKEQPDAV